MKNIFKTLNINITDEHFKKFELYYNYLISENKKYNLTALKEKEDIYIKHFYDSLTLFKTNKMKSINLLDIGSGAGFPSIPIKIINNDIKITIVESQKKKTEFLKALLNKLEINGEVINERAENLNESYLNRFDVVTARAVAPLNILIELTIPFVKTGGYFIAMKGSSYEVELNDAKRGIITLGAKIEKIIEFDLPNKAGKRSLIIIKKTNNILGYPRPYQNILKKPLGSDSSE